MFLLRLLIGLLCMSGAASACAAEGATHRLIIHFKEARLRAAQMPDADTERALGVSAGMRVRGLRPMSGGAQVMVLPSALQGVQLAAVLERLRRNPRVASVSADQREHLQAVPNDPNFSSQWYLAAPAAVLSGINAALAWDRGSGVAAMAAVTVAVVDSGVRLDHPDLAGHLLPGYDFIGANCIVGDAGCSVANQFAVANDGDGRDADPSDPGDWVSSADQANPVFAGCPLLNSRWHGTRVAGLVGAATNNGLGVAGIHWNARILPVRVLGKCGGYQSDVADGIRWAAGLPVPGVPANANPARIINVGVGSAGTCADSEYASAISDVTTRGAIVVASAGNDNAGLLRPANCPGVISVGALRRDGQRAAYSNSGADLSLMAPGGTFPESILSASNVGPQAPFAYNAAGHYDGLSGTSFSAPMVSGSAALMLSLAPRLTAAQLSALLRSSARPFVAVVGSPTCVPGGTGDPNNLTPCNCTTAACGAGMLDADAAAAAAQGAALDNRAPVIFPIATQTVAPGASLSFTVISGDANGDAVTLSALAVPAGATFDAARGVFNWPVAGAVGNYTLSVRASDGTASSDATIQIVVSNAPATSTGGGGGGRIAWAELAALLMAALWLRKQLNSPV